MAGERGLDADLGRLEVADLAHHDDVGVLAQEGAQRGREVEADLVVHLHLVDAHQVELDGVLGGRDVGAHLVQLGERRVERGGLAAAGRPGHQHHPERLVDGVLEVLEGRLLEAELGHVELEVRLVEQTEHHLLAEHGGQDGDTEVHILVAAELHLDAAVLRQAALGDVELRHHLDARRERVLQPERRLHDLVEHAVDAEADAEHLLVGLDVHVARPLADGVGQERVHQADDGRLFRRSLELLQVDLVLALHQLDRLVAELREHLVVVGLAVVIALDGVLDDGGRGDRDLGT